MARARWKRILLAAIGAVVLLALAVLVAAVVYLDRST
ncbi:MAG: hypothetical protein QOE34_1438, partial [Verrucomicrobiota bacterium]